MKTQGVKRLSWLLSSFFLWVAGPAVAQYVMDRKTVPGSSLFPAVHQSTDKKLIQTSASLQWAYVNDNIAAMQARHPYLDGVAASMNGNFAKDYLMLRGDRLWTEDDVQLKTVSAIKWGRYTDNFVILYFGDSLSLDFFDDRKWSIITQNAGMVSKMIRAGGFKGVFLDNENYYEGSHGWKYDPSWYQGHSLGQVKARCRQRGHDFMTALQAHVPNPLTVLDFIWFGDHWNNYDTTAGRQLLWLSFKDGMLDAARLNDILVDGNEMAYYYQESTMFTDIYTEFRRHRFPAYGATDLQDKYKKQVQIGHGIYPSLYYGVYKWPHTYSPAEHDRWWENQLYNALLTTDKYVWIWTEPDENWWKEGPPLFTPAFTDIAKRVRATLKKQQGLSFDLVKYGANWQGNLVTPAEKWHVSRSPTITITAPSATAKTNGTFTISTAVSGQTSRVEFFINSMRVGIDSTAPYTTRVTQLAPGTYTLFARAFDRANEHTTAAPVIITVRPK
ncbi:hypothetical protein J2I47_08875 [Fibrella sp. HMF5335]|uniref:Uncharacterized protein n=1 Tax=Fibrella rubiginis TaxID=2817060 RepID=A0A939K2T5_9BACT|nr:Ig-like domain-containing protein [Fibrella rubiginis]MBO0936654.1 hypothetical protein [Fibrella rubiginis]